MPCLFLNRLVAWGCLCIPEPWDMPDSLNNNVIYGGLGPCSRFNLWKSWRLNNYHRTRGWAFHIYLANPHLDLCPPRLRLTVLCACCHTWLLGEISTVHTTPLGEKDWKLAPVLSWALPYTPFAFADFNLYPFTVLH